MTKESLSVLRSERRVERVEAVRILMNIKVHAGKCLISPAKAG